MRLYHPSRLLFRKGRWYVSVTKPKGLQFGSDRQARRSTGTSDRKQAQYLQHRLTEEIYAEFDRQLDQADPVFEFLRPVLEANGVHTRQWYQEGFVLHTARGGETIASRFAKMQGALIKLEGKLVGEKMPFLERWRARNHVELCAMVSSGFGHPIPATVLAMLSPEDRAAVLAKAEPSEMPTGSLLRVAKTLPDEMATNIIEAARIQTSVVLAENTENVTASAAENGHLAHIIEDYLCSRPKKSRRSDRVQLNKWLQHKLGSKPLAQIDQYDLFEFFEEQGENLSKSSIRVLKAAMSNVFNWARKQRKLDING